jgi:Rrf2 family protein
LNIFLTKECDYGLRIIRTLADGRKQSVKEICDTEHVPDQYAYKILKKLERAGFVQSLRGRDGGYRLIKSLDAVSIYDVVSAIDENLFLFECLREGNTCPHKAGQNQTCAIHCEFERIQKILIDEMRRETMNNILT